MPVKRRGVHRLSKLQIALVLLLIAAVLAGAYVVALRWEARQRKPEPTGDHNARHEYDVTVQRGGQTYRQKANLTTILLMGIDNDGEQEISLTSRSGGQADFLRLIVIDKNAKTVSQLPIDRDTMTPITILGVLGNRSGTRTAQICLAHGFGNGREQSCELTREAVSNLLYGARIDYYMALNYTGIGTLNEALGGVTVTLEDDFSHIDPAMTQGSTITLHGDQAERYVRTRLTIGEGTNESRMRRQQQFISNALSLMTEQMNQDESFMDRLFDELSPYMVNNIGRSRLALEAYEARAYDRPDLLQIAGIHTIGEDGFVQFLAEEESVEDITLKLFYDQLN